MLRTREGVGREDLAPLSPGPSLDGEASTHMAAQRLAVRLTLGPVALMRGSAGVLMAVQPDDVPWLEQDHAILLPRPIHEVCGAADVGRSRGNVQQQESSHQPEGIGTPSSGNHQWRVGGWG